MKADFSTRTQSIEMWYYCWGLRWHCTANYPSVEVEVVQTAGDDADQIAEMIGLMLQVTYFYCHHLLWSAWTKPLRTDVPKGKAIGKLISQLIFWCSMGKTIWICILAKYRNGIFWGIIKSTDIIKLQISIHISTSIYLPSPIKLKENYTSVTKFLRLTSKVCKHV